jgi:uracil-DNA glycosylase family 4
VCRLFLRDLPLTVAPGAEQDVEAQLAALRSEVECCSKCVLSGTRTQAVFGEGDAHAGLMFVGEAPGYNEDKQGRPFVGAAGKLLAELLGSIGLTRDQVYIANVLKSRPPDNRDPRPEEVEACRPYLMRQIALIRPAVICSLGNFATKLLSGSQTGITKVHGVPQLREVEGHRFYLYPIFHPAAALYTPAVLETLKADFYRLPQLMTTPPPDDEPAQLLGAEAGTEAAVGAAGGAVARGPAADAAAGGPATDRGPAQAAGGSATRPGRDAGGDAGAAETDASGGFGAGVRAAAFAPGGSAATGHDGAGGRGDPPEAPDAEQLGLF